MNDKDGYRTKEMALERISLLCLLLSFCLGIFSCKRAHSGGSNVLGNSGTSSKTSKHASLVEDVLPRDLDPFDLEIKDWINQGHDYATRRVLEEYKAGKKIYFIRFVSYLAPQETELALNLVIENRDRIHNETVKISLKIIGQNLKFDLVPETLERLREDNAMWLQSGHLLSPLSVRLADHDPTAARELILRSGAAFNWETTDAANLIGRLDLLPSDDPSELLTVPWLISSNGYREAVVGAYLKLWGDSQSVERIVSKLGDLQSLSKFYESYLPSTIDSVESISNASESLAFLTDESLKSSLGFLVAERVRTANADSLPTLLKNYFSSSNPSGYVSRALTQAYANSTTPFEAFDLVMQHAAPEVKIESLAMAYEMLLERDSIAATERLKDVPQAERDRLLLITVQHLWSHKDSTMILDYVNAIADPGIKLRAAEFADKVLQRELRHSDE